MKRGKKVALTIFLLGVLVVKFVLPNFGSNVRRGLDAFLDKESEAVTTFAEHLKLHSLASNDEQHSQQPEQTKPSPKPTYIFVDVVNNTEPPSTTEPIASELETPDPIETIVEETPEPLPPAVAAFLESQKSFSEYEIPEKVEYNYVRLPFDYAVPVAGYNSSGFGYRMHPILNTVRFHYGTDFAAYSGEKVLAFADGTVSFAGYDDSFGWHVRISHGENWETLYAHCSQLYVATGENVAAEECIALVGASGLATGPHLHFELTHNGKYLNPEYYINS